MEALHKDGVRSWQYLHDRVVVLLQETRRTPGQVLGRSSGPKSSQFFDLAAEIVVGFPSVRC